LCCKNCGYYCIVRICASSRRLLQELGYFKEKVTSRCRLLQGVGYFKEKVTSKSRLAYFKEKVNYFKE